MVALGILIVAGILVTILLCIIALVLIRDGHRNKKID
jgi:hypothetical protein